MNEYYNDKGYPDPTVYKAICDDNRADARERKGRFLIRIIRFIIWESGFALLNRIELEDRVTKRIIK